MTRVCTTAVVGKVCAYVALTDALCSAAVDGVNSGAQARSPCPATTAGAAVLATAPTIAHTICDRAKLRGLQSNSVHSNSGSKTVPNRGDAKVHFEHGMLLLHERPSCINSWVATISLCAIDSAVRF